MDRLTVEGIGERHLGPELAQTIRPLTRTRHAYDLMAKRRERPYKRQADGASGTCDKDLHSGLPDSALCPSLVFERSLWRLAETDR